jgi:predicted nucleotidyltransferase
VLVVGSLLEGTHFGERSDIDLAVDGLLPSDHFAALERLRAEFIAFADVLEETGQG